MKVSVSEPSDLEAVNSILHDHWFDVDRIERRGESLLLPISGTSRSKPRSADFSKMLVVNPVRALLVDDRERIGYYDLNHIEIHPDRSLLVLEFNIPIRIEIALGGLPVVLEVLDLVATSFAGLDRSVIERYPWIEPRSWQLAMLREGPHDWIGIWEALAYARDEEPAMQRVDFLAAIDRLLATDLFQAGVPRRDGGFDRWPGTREEVVARIDREWQALGHDPYLGEIVWFAATPTGVELATAWPRLDFVDEPRGALFRELLHWLCAQASGFLLVLRDRGMPRSPSLHAALAALAPWRTGEEEVSRWPGTMLLGGSATRYRHRCDVAAAAVLADLAAGAFDWQQPALPEDLCFVDARGRALLANTAHERFLSLDLTPDELDDLRREVPAVLDLLRRDV